MTEKWEHYRDELEAMTEAKERLQDKLFEVRASEAAAWKRVDAIEALRACGPPRAWPIGLHWRGLAKALLAEHGDDKAPGYLASMLHLELVEIAATAARFAPPPSSVRIEDLALLLIYVVR